MPIADAELSFASRLRAYRLAARLTQETLAERAGISARTIQDLERGVTQPHRDTSRKLSRALQLSDDSAVRTGERRRTVTP